MSEFQKFCHVQCLQMEISLKKFHRVQKYMAKFVGEMMFELEFDFKTFSIANIQYRLFCVNFW
jgi:hypothetical protein